MAYQKPSAPQSAAPRTSGQAAYVPKTPVVAAPAAVPAQSSGKQRASHDIVQIDDQGEIMRDADGKGIELGGIWPGKGPDSPLFIKFADGRVAKAFKKRPKPE